MTRKEGMEYVREKYERDYLFEFADLSDPNSLVDGKDTILHIAVTRGDVDVVEILISNGADVNAIGKMGETPLHAAASGGNLDIVKRIIAAGADQKIVSEFGFTACEKAKNFGRERIVKFLEGQ